MTERRRYHDNTCYSGLLPVLIQSFFFPEGIAKSHLPSLQCVYQLSEGEKNFKTTHITSTGRQSGEGEKEE